MSQVFERAHTSCLWRIPSFPEVSCILPSCYAARTGSHRVSSLFNEAVARCFHTSASQGVERDGIHATRAGILGSSGIRPLWVFDTVLDREIPSDKIGGSRSA